eukprot:NODE_849_length_3547_cov_0.451856.p4 type:complete len:102 gc:universal NODE_849_length_3547_cov_0.451856:226-531(+)
MTVKMMCAEANVKMILSQEWVSQSILPVNPLIKMKQRLLQHLTQVLLVLPHWFCMVLLICFNKSDLLKISFWHRSSDWMCGLIVNWIRVVFTTSNPMIFHK